MEQSTDQEG